MHAPRSRTTQALLMAAAMLGFGFAAATALDAVADSPAGQTTYIPLAPCRLVDTRPATQVGPRSTPIGQAEVHIQQVTGTNGDCAVPASATAVSLNVTAVLPTEPSHMTVFPYGPAVPNASNLNYAPGQPPAFNKVDVQLDGSGRLGFFNLKGRVHLVADVNGYYITDGLDGLDQALGALQARVRELEKIRTLSAYVASNGQKIGAGDYVVTKHGTGAYEVFFDLEPHEIPREGLDGRSVSATASPTCASHSVSVTRWTEATTTATGNWAFVSFLVTIQNGSNVPANCAFQLVATFGDPSPFHLTL